MSPRQERGRAIDPKAFSNDFGDCVPVHHCSPQQPLPQATNARAASLRAAAVPSAKRIQRLLLEKQSQIARHVAAATIFHAKSYKTAKFVQFCAGLER